MARIEDIDISFKAYLNSPFKTIYNIYHLTDLYFGIHPSLIKMSYLFIFLTIVLLIAY